MNGVHYSPANMAQFVKEAPLLIFTEKCIEKYFVDYDFLDGKDQLTSSTGIALVSLVGRSCCNSVCFHNLRMQFASALRLLVIHAKSYGSGRFR